MRRRRLAPTGGQQARATRVEVSQEGQDEETEAPLASSAWSVRPRSAEMSIRIEDVLSSRKRESEEAGLAEDPRLVPADELVGISKMAVIFMPLDVAPANFKVVELFCRNRFGDAAVSMGFERGIVVDCATGWDMEDEEQVEEVERRVRDEEAVLLIGSPKVPCLQHLD